MTTDTRVDPAATTEVDSLEEHLTAYKKLKSAIDALNVQLEAEKDVIREYMGDSNEDVHIGAFKVSNRPVATPRVDASALKAAYPEIYEEFVRVTVTRRLLVK